MRTKFWLSNRGLVKFLPTLCLSIASPAFAGFQGNVEFTDLEKETHLQQMDQFLETASDCLHGELDRHKQFMKKYGVSAFYGENSSFAKKAGPNGTKVPTTVEEKRKMLLDADVDEDLAKQMVPDQPCAGGVEECPLMMQPTSCIGIALKCISKSLKATGQDQTWAKLRKYVVMENQSTGNALLDGLQKLGWKLAYWNPDTDKNEKWDAKDQKDYPGNPQNIWGQHAAMWKQVQTSHMYYFNHVDDWETLVDFGGRTPRATKDAGFFVGIAHLGYHVFPGSYGRVLEGHSTREITDKKTVEESAFSPDRFLGGGGPRGGPYKSGLMALPPGVLDHLDRR